MPRPLAESAFQSSSMTTIGKRNCMSGNPAMAVTTGAVPAPEKVQVKHKSRGGGGPLGGGGDREFDHGAALPSDTDITTTTDPPSNQPPGPASPSMAQAPSAASSARNWPKPVRRSR